MTWEKMLPKAINTPKRGSKFSDLYILVVVCKEEEKSICDANQKSPWVDAESLQTKSDSKVNKSGGSRSIRTILLLIYLMLLTNDDYVTNDINIWYLLIKIKKNRHLVEMCDLHFFLLQFKICRNLRIFFFRCITFPKCQGSFHNFFPFFFMHNYLYDPICISVNVHMCTLSYILLDFQTYSVTATLQSIQYVTEKSLSPKI